MNPGTKIKIVYCTWSKFKIEEWDAARDRIDCPGRPGNKLADVFDIVFRPAETREPLLCDLEEMVKAKAESAYRALKVPCVVEHAGLILAGHEAQSYPGGLTQPMWDALGAENFARACEPLGLGAIARAVIGYCDGMSLRTFIGDTRGTISPIPRGDRKFYWDTVFCPDEFNGKTYAEVVSTSADGLASKITASQSIKALTAFLEFRLSHEPSLFLV